MSPATPARRARARHLALVVSGGALVSATLIAFTGGIGFELAGLAVQARRPWIAAIIGVAALAAALRVAGAAAVRHDLESAWRSGGRTWALVAATAAFGVAVVGLVWGTWTASGADAYGYVSQALMWADGKLSVSVPLAQGAPWPSPEWTLSPFGWRPALHPDAIVPTYAPGLPLLMALASILAGETAVFWVVPLTGALAVWWTWKVGGELTGARAAAAGAVLVASAPAFLFQIVQPMSDVPVTAWWTGALLFVLRQRPVLAGACASAAILTRPNLAPLAAWLAAALLLSRRSEPAGGSRSSRPSWRRRGADLAWFVGAVTPGVTAWLGINHVWYGHALTSGYGSAGDLFDAANIGPNAIRYGRWLIESHTPFVLLALTSPAALWWTTRRATRGGAGEPVREARGNAGAGPIRDRPRAIVVSFGFAALVVCAYLPYAPFQEWTYLRFLLPALPVLLLLSCHAAVRLLARLPGALALAALLLGTTALAGHQIDHARDGRAFDLQRLERRYRETGREAASRLPDSAVLLAVQHSGSLRLYAGRTTLRWDLLEAPSFDRALAHLRAHGFTPVIVLESWEEPQFRGHVSPHSPVGQLDWPPSVELDLAVKVRFYDPGKRAAFMGGARVPTVRVRPDRRR